MQQASYLEGGLLMWMLPLYPHINQKSDDDHHDGWTYLKLKHRGDKASTPYTEGCFGETASTPCVEETVTTPSEDSLWDKVSIPWIDCLGETAATSCLEALFSKIRSRNQSVMAGHTDWQSEQYTHPAPPAPTPHPPSPTTNSLLGGIIKVLRDILTLYLG